MKIRYYNTLYRREDSFTILDGKFDFEDGRVVFSWCGTRKAIEVEYIIAIEKAEDM